MDASKLRYPLNNYQQCLKKSVYPLNIFLGNDNSQDNDAYITKYIKMRGYTQDPTHTCTYHRNLSTLTANPVTTLLPNQTIVLPDKGCDVKFINCGNGDACLIENQGRYALIDFGGKEDAVKDYLDKHMKSKTIDYAICTHFHSDHMTDFYNVLSNYKVKNLFVVKNIGKNLNKATKKELINFDVNCNAQTVTMLEIGSCLDHHSHDFTLGNAHFEFIGPVNDHKNLNDNSIVLKMNYKNTSVLFTGDISSNTEKELVLWCRLNNINLKSQIIKVAHHGAKGSTSNNLLKYAEPSVAVISCAKVNTYTHPDSECVERLTNHNCETFVTYDDKSVDFHITTQGELRYGKSKIYLPFSAKATERLPS